MSGKRIFGALTIAAALFAIWPAVIGNWQRIGAMRDGVAQREDLLSQRQEILATLMTVSQEYQRQTAQDEGRNLLAIIPVRKDTAELVSALHGIATRTGVRIGELRISEATQNRNEPTKVLNIGVELSGSYGAMRDFLAAMEREIRLLNVTDISVSDDPSGDLRFSIVADAYFIK